tara:strand:+ start:556 stop:762 length:207 start_codon:yes stop_codon:yes gene_type:complete
MTREHLESEGFDIKSLISGGKSPESKRGKSRGISTRGRMSTMSATGYSSKKGETEVTKVISSKLQEVS